MKTYRFYALFCAVFLFTACNNTSKTTGTAPAVSTADSIKNAQPVAEASGSDVSDLKADLQKMEWILAQVNVGKIVSPANVKGHTLQFKDTGFSAKFCNNMSGAYTVLPENRIQLEKVISTKIFCRTPDYIMAVESFLKDGIFDVDITKGYLTLAMDENSLVFTRKSTPDENPMAN